MFTHLLWWTGLLASALHPAWCPSGSPRGFTLHPVPEDTVTPFLVSRWESQRVHLSPCSRGHRDPCRSHSRYEPQLLGRMSHALPLTRPRSTAAVTDCDRMAFVRRGFVGRGDILCGEKNVLNKQWWNWEVLTSFFTTKIIMLLLHRVEINKSNRNQISGTGTWNINGTQP